MGMRVVILNGSPRRTGNTAALAAEFTRGAEEAGNSVAEFFLDSMDIHGCKGCFGGHSSRECPCVQKDDMDKIYPAVKECDVVVLAGGNGSVGDIKGKPELQKAYELGKSIQ